MNTTRLWFVITLMLILVPGAFGQTGLRPPTDPASWVPADALAYLGITDFREFTQRFEQTELYRLMRDPDARDNWKQVSTILKLQEVLKERLANSLDTKPELLKNPFGGPMAVYIPTPPDGVSSKPQAVFVAQVADAELMNDYYQRAVKTLGEVAARHEKIPYAAYTLDCFYASEVQEPDTNEPGRIEDEMARDLELDDPDDSTGLDSLFGKLLSTDTLPEKLVLCLAENRLIAAGTPEHVKDVLARTNSDESLFATAAYQRFEQQFKSPGTLRYMLNLPGWFELMRKAGGAEAEQALTLLGAKNMRSIIGHTAFNGEGYDSRSEAVLLLEGERTGLIKLLDMENQPVTPVSSVGANNLFYARLSADATEVYRQLEQMIRLVDEQAADGLRDASTIELAGGEILNLQMELFEHLKPPLAFMLAFEQPYAAHSTRVKITLAHTQRAAIGRFLEKLAELFPGMLLVRETGEAKIYDNKLLNLALAVTERELLIGTTAAVVAGIEKSHPQSSLANDPTFRKAAGLVADKAWGVVYVDTPRMFTAAVELQKYKDSLLPTQPANAIALAIVKVFTNGIDSEDLETVRRLKSYQVPNIITLTNTPAGIHIMHARVR